ncbi:MAG: DoxX family protein [Bacteroidetes bacterium]|nr:MAG: DoxX family protein [Bacteroidota bacterium]
MKKATTIARILLGAIFTLFSLMYFFNMMPAQEMHGATATFMTGLFSSGYMMTLVKAIELICGIALITGQFVPLTTVVIFPITLNIFLFHAFLEPASVAMSIVLLALNLFLAYTQKERYQLILARK